MISPVVPVSSPRQVSNYVALPTLVTAIIDVNDNLPQTSLPTEVPGTVQEQVRLLPPVTIYNSYGKIVKSQEKGNLIAYA